MFLYIVGITSFVIASLAAFFSIKGIGLLFSGSFWPVVLMAGSLEIGKLVAASSLYRLYSELNKLLKIYLFTAVIVLMGITSLGIFGFLTDAYYKSKTKSDAITQQVTFLEETKNTYTSKFNFNNQRIKTLSELRSSQEERTKIITSQNVETKTSKSGGLFGGNQTLSVIDKNALESKQKMLKDINDDIKSSNDEIKSLTNENEELLLKLEDTNSKLVAAKDIQSKQTDIGTFKFIANAFNLELDTAVKFFIFCLVFVFDPLAVILLLVYNHLLKKKLI